jgi:GLPGLI family protein
LFVFAQDIQKDDLLSIVSYEKLSAVPDSSFKDFPKSFQDIAKTHKDPPTYYDLFFNNTEALYKKVDKKAELQQDEMNTGNIQMKVTKVDVSSTVEMYKNYKTKTIIDSRKILDKEFLVSEDLRKIDWELINEIKKIGSFECKKAQAKIGDDLIEAWYTPNIPTMAGPSIYWGLPGLIVEVKTKSLYFIATQIKENVQGKIEIPTKGKKISKEEFQKLAKERLDEMTKDKPSFRVVNE